MQPVSGIAQHGCNKILLQVKGIKVKMDPVIFMGIGGGRLNLMHGKWRDQHGVAGGAGVQDIVDGNVALSAHDRNELEIPCDPIAANGFRVIALVAEGVGNEGHLTDKIRQGISFNIFSHFLERININQSISYVFYLTLPVYYIIESYCRLNFMGGCLSQ